MCINRFSTTPMPAEAISEIVSKSRLLCQPVKIAT